MTGITHISDAKALITATWDDVPHLTEEKKAQLLGSIPEYMRDARSKGVPSLGAGAIWPIPKDQIVCAPFAIPDHWRRCYALDVGWKITAALWLAQDPTDGRFYAYSEYYRGQQLPIVHAEAIKARGKWIKGCIDPAARGRSTIDGKRMMVEYTNAGLDLSKAKNEVETGIYRVHTALTTGQLQIFSTLPNFFAEYAIYRREVKTNEFGMERAIIVKAHDHLMDCIRYAMMTFEAVAEAKPAPRGRTYHTGPGDRTVGL